MAPEQGRQAPPDPASGDDPLPKIRGEREGDPNRPGSGPGIMPGGPILGVTVRLGGQIEERFAETPQGPVDASEAVSATETSPEPSPAPVAPPRGPIDGDTVIDDEPVPRTLNDILAERAGL
jgi:hypothetical protein